MTSPGGGDINLATLWIPIVPETSHIGEAARRAGEEMKREFGYGFGSSEEFGAAIGSGILRGIERSDIPGVFDPIMGAISGKQALLIGSVAGAVTAGLDLVTHGVEAMLDMVVEAGEKVIDEVVEIGLKFDELNKSIILYTNDQTDQLENLQGMARDVYGELDVGAEKLGKNMAILSKQFDLSGETLKQLAYEVTELEGRFGGLDIQSLSAAMHQFGIEGKDISGVLQTIVDDARQTGTDVNKLEQAIVTTGPVFDQLGIGVYGASEAMSKMIQLGDRPEQIMRGIQREAAAMGKSGSSQDLRDFTMQLLDTMEAYKASRNTFQLEELSNTVWGSRFWATNLQNLETLRDAINGVGNSVRGMPIQKVIDDSRTVVEEWTLFQHQLELFVQPVGDTVMKSLQKGLQELQHWFEEHHDEILMKIQEYGHTFIRLLPDIQRFAADAVEFMGVFFNFAIKGFNDLVNLGGELVELWGKLSGNEEDVKLGERIIAETDKISKIDFTKISDALANGIRGIDLTNFQGELSKNLDEAIEKALKGPTGIDVHSGLMVSIKADPKKPDGGDSHDPLDFLGIPHDGLHIPTTLEPAPGTPGAPGGPGGGPWQGAPPGQSPPQQAPGQGTPAPPNTHWEPDPTNGGFKAVPNPGTSGPESGQPGHTPGSSWGDVWDYVKGWFDGKFQPPGDKGRNPNSPAPVIVPNSFTQFDSAGGVPIVQNADGTWGSTDPSWDHLMKRESGGQANIIQQIKDANSGPNAAQGLFQITPATWASAGGSQFGPSPAQASPYAQAIVAGNILRSNPSGSDWGAGAPGRENASDLLSGLGGMSYMPQGGGSGGDFGGLQQVIFSNPQTGQKTGEAGPFSGGGAPSSGQNQLVGPGTTDAGYYSADWEGHTGHVHTSWTTGPDGQPYGLPADTVIGQGESGFPGWVYDLGQRYGLIASTYSGHQVLSDGLQHGIDWWPAAGGVMYPGAGGYSGDQVDQLQTFASTMATSGAASGAGYAPMGSGGSSGGGGGGAQVYLADFHSGGGAPLSPGGHGGGGGGGGHHGGGGGKGTPYDPYKIPLQLDQRQDAIDDANRRIKDMQQTLDLDEARLPELKQKLEAANARMSGILPSDPEYASLHAAQVEAQVAYDRLNGEIDDLQKSKIPGAERKLTEAQMKAQEPLKGGGSTGGGQYSAAEQLGAGFLSGLASDLGMGNVLGGKTPDQWGIVKLLGGLAGYGVGLGNSMLGVEGANNVFGTSGAGPGLAAGLPGIPGLPSIAKLAAPFVLGPGGAAQHPGAVGPQPGPGSLPHGGNVIDSSINLTGNNFRDIHDVVRTVSNIQNSRAPGIYTSLPGVTMV
jgi:hypothetical protein